MQIVKVAVPGPFPGGLDYQVSQEIHIISGARVRVPLGRRRLTGLVLEVLDHTDVDLNKLKSIEAAIDNESILSSKDIKLLQWVAQYYHHSIGDVLYTALPSLLAEGKPFLGSSMPYWFITDLGKQAQDSLKAPKQKLALAWMNAEGREVSRAEWQDAGISAAVMNALLEKGYVEKTDRAVLPSINHTITPSLTLNPAQATVLDACVHQLGKFSVKLLEGVTGSGKTEIYLQLIEKVINRGQQALVLVPEIGLTPQMLARFKARFKSPIVTLHSGLTDSERLQHWYWAATGEAKIIIGTRSAIFVPCKSLGVIIVDEEHDASFKQQTGVRYSARDVAVLRAQMEGLPVILGSATPSLESLYNAKIGKYGHLQLPARAGLAVAPRFHLIDLRQQPLEAGLSRPLLHEIEKHIEAGGQALIFLNRRGYAPVLMCHGCGWLAQCKHCDAYYTIHQRPWHLSCHHCGTTHGIYKTCQECGEAESLIQVGVGTERVEEALQKRFPQYPIARLDRNSVQKKGKLESILDSIHSGEVKILIGTQMLAKGHHFAGVTMVGIINMDGGLFSSDFRALEHTGQLLMQVAGRSGREERQGEVYIQTHHPEHPLLRTLLERGYNVFAEKLLEERVESNWPPFSHLALLRAEHRLQENAFVFLKDIKLTLQSWVEGEVEILGPVPALMQRKAGLHRLQLLIRAADRKRLHLLLTQFEHWIASVKLPSGIRWSMDVDPTDLA